MHWLDITILIVLGIGAVFGFWSGLLWQVARVVSLLLSLYVAITVNPHVTEWLQEQWNDTGEVVCRVVAFVAAFLLVYVTLYMLTRLIHKAIKATKLEMVDRVLGALLGIAKMSAIVSGLCALLMAIAIPMTQTWMEESTLAPHFARGTNLMISLIPKVYRDQLDDNLKQARDQVQKKVTDAALDSLKADEVKN